MFGRSATFQIKSDKRDQFANQVEFVRDKLKPLDGMIQCCVAWDENGAGMTMVLYDSEASADAAMPTVQSIWADLADYIEGPPSLTNYPNAHQLSE
jgi:hypothetical protein